MEVRFVHPQKSGDPPHLQQGCPKLGGCPKAGCVPQNGVGAPKRGVHPKAGGVPPCPKPSPLQARGSPEHHKPR